MRTVLWPSGLPVGNKYGVKVNWITKTCHKDSVVRYRVLGAGAGGSGSDEKEGITVLKTGNVSAVACAPKCLRTDFCGGVANSTGYRPAGAFSEAIVELPAVAEINKVQYQVGSGNPDADGADALKWSAWFNITAPPLPGNAVSFYAFGDMGEYENDSSRQTGTSEGGTLPNTNYMKSLRSTESMVLHIGDISYARGYTASWDIFHDQIEELSANMYYMTAEGNHERDWPTPPPPLSSSVGSDTTPTHPGISLFPGVDSKGECGVAYEERFHMPTPSMDEPWYSFDYGAGNPYLSYLSTVFLTIYLLTY